MANWLTQSLGAPQDRPHARLGFDTLPGLIYAVGDVHGQLHLLEALEAKIATDRAQTGQEALLVMLGDYVDRGPATAGVIAHLLAPPPSGFERLCLCGNHEAAMLDFLGDPGGRSNWLGFGGRETLLSYGLDDNDLMLPATELGDRLATALPRDHIDFLTDLAALARFPGVTFVHAGLRPGTPIAEQNERDLFWIRHEFYEHADELDGLVVHGHTPQPEVFISRHRINVDTGAFASGRLSAIKLVEGQPAGVLSVQGAPA